MAMVCYLGVKAEVKVSQPNIYIPFMCGLRIGPLNSTPKVGMLIRIPPQNIIYIYIPDN